MSNQENINRQLTSDDYQSAEKNSSGNKVDLLFPGEFDMILAYREKMRLLSINLNKDSIRNEPLNEPLGLLLDKEKIQTIIEQRGFHSLVAFFGVEDPTNPMSRNTLVIMGADSDNKLLPYDLDHGLFTQISETWSLIVDQVDNEKRFQEFFRIERKD